MSSSHVAVSNDRIKQTPTDAWLPVNSQIAKLVNQWADRRDLIVLVGQDAGGQTAFYNPEIDQIEMNTDVCFGKNLDPETIPDLTIRTNQFEYVKGIGAVSHEAFHARFTTFDLRQSFDDLGEKAYEQLMNLEESRIEKQGVRVLPGQRSFLRACALNIVLNEEREEQEKEKKEAKETEMPTSGIRQAARLALLSLARVDAGILQKEDVAKFEPILESILTAELIGKFRGIWKEFQDIRDSSNARQLRRMHELAREFSALLDEAAQEEDANEERQKQIQQAIQEAMQEMAESAADAQASAENDAFDQDMEERRQEAEQQQKERQEEKKKSEGKAKEVFGNPDEKSDKKSKNLQSGGHLTYGDSRSRVVEERDPSDEERISAITVSRALERAKYHDRVRIEDNSATPPGRLRTRSAMQGAAYKSMNIRNKVEPFRRVQRKHTIDPDLTVGTMFDISGSMGGAMEPMGVTAWVMSEAVKKIQGTFAMVSYGHTVNPILAPGEHQDRVKVYSAPDGSEAFQDGFLALDGALNLLQGRGARLLVVVSDGQYKADEYDYAKKWLTRCAEEGVAVVWVGYGHASAAEEHCNATGAQFIRPLSTPAEVAQQIGQAAVNALNEAGAASRTA